METWKWMCAAALLGSTASAARGETWADWRPDPDRAALAAEYRPGWAVDARRREDHRRRATDVLAPNRGWVGDLVFSPAPGQEAPRGPLTVHLLHAVVPPGEANWPDDEGIGPFDFVPAPRPRAVPRPAAAEETWTRPAEFPLRVPVVLPRSCESPGEWRHSYPPALFPRYEVRDAAGRILCRGWLPAHAVGEGVRSLVGIVENDEALRRLTEQTGAAERVRDLPNEMAAYRQIRAIWFTEPLWAAVQGREDLLRRLVLGGVRLTGETALVQRIQTTLGAGWEGLAVAESIRPGAWNSRNEFSLRTVLLANETNRKNPRRAVPKPTRIGTEADWFQEELRSYVAWTLGGVLVFAAGAAAILAGVFLRHKGERRVAIWWALPTWTVLCAAGIWAGGLAFLARRPRVDVTEYRLALAGWPEMHCRAVATAMTFESGRPEWRLPAEALAQGRRYVQLDGWWKREDLVHSEHVRRLRMPRQQTGTRIELEAGWYEPAAAPFALESGTGDSPGRGLAAAEDLDGACVLIEGVWHDLGPLKSGERRDPRAAPMLAGNLLTGLPTALSEAWAGCFSSRPAPDNPHRHQPPRHDWIVVAWRGDPAPRVALAHDQALVKGRVVWVWQCP